MASITFSRFSSLLNYVLDFFFLSPLVILIIIFNSSLLWKHTITHLNHIVWHGINVLPLSPSSAVVGDIRPLLYFLLSLHFCIKIICFYILTNLKLFRHQISKHNQCVQWNHQHTLFLGHLHIYPKLQRNIKYSSPLSKAVKYYNN